MSSLIHTLELVKYFTFSNSLIIHYSLSAEYEDYENVQIDMPEGLSFKIKNLRFNYFKPQEKNIHNYIKVDWGNMVMQPSQTGLTFNVDQDKVYVFHSNQFLALSPDEQISEKAKFSTKVSTGGFWGYIYCVVIQVEGGSSVTNFENFMELIKNDWITNFLTVLDDALYTTHTIDELIKYPPLVIIDVLRSDPQILGVNKIKAIITLIINYWNGSLSNISNEDKMAFLFELMELVSIEESGDVYNLFFENTSLIFLRVRNLLSDEEMILFNMRLMNIYYMNINMTTYENEIKNLPKDHLIPIISEDLPFGWTTLLTVGPTPYFEMLDSGLKINEIKFHVYNIGNEPPVVELVGTANPFYIIQNKHYDYNEIIGLIPCFDKKEFGLMRGMVYPVPAFAFEAFHKGLSKYYTIYKYITDLSNAAGIIFPFFKILQAEAVVVSLISLLIGETGLILDTDFGLQKKLQETSKGKIFLYTYFFVSGFWGGIDVGKAISENKLKALYDFENLLSVWGIFMDSNDFSTVEDDPNIDDLINRMEEIKVNYNLYKKH